MNSSLRWTIPALLLFSVQSEAIRMPLWKAKRTDLNRRATSLSKRTTNMVSGTIGNGSQLLEDASDVLYLANITVGGSQFAVQIDTGR